MSVYEKIKYFEKISVIRFDTSSAADAIADYRGQLLWDPGMQTGLTECDRASP